MFNDGDSGNIDSSGTLKHLQHLTPNPKTNTRNIRIMSEPKQLQPQYLGSSKNAPAPRNPMVAFWNDQVMAPEHRSENLG